MERIKAISESMSEKKEFVKRVAKTEVNASILIIKNFSRILYRFPKSPSLDSFVYIPADFRLSPEEPF